MSFEQRARRSPSSPGPYVATVVNHLDPLRMGRLEVSIKGGMQNIVDTKKTKSDTPLETYIAQYASPFHGETSVRFEGTNNKDFNDVQKSYGFWMVPPDIGTRVLIIFADGDPNQCYWIGCVQDNYQNFMTPGIASSKNSNLTPAQLLKYGGVTNLPVAEYLKKTETLSDPNIETKKKPVHPFADRLLQQGLLIDDIRGNTTSSARRETPSTVFGISTPGPIDPTSPKKPISQSGKTVASVSRLGGSTFVMDDGDVNGDNELVRIRTRTGHQILLHNTADLIYIANAKGTAWIELTSNGKIDVYAEDSISMHTYGDFNFKADRDINLEAGRRFNIVSSSNDVNINSGGNLNVLANGILVRSFNDINLTSDADTKIAVGGGYGLAITKDQHVLTGGNSNHSSLGQYSITSAVTMALKSNEDLALSGGASVSMTAAVLNLNGAPALDPNPPEPPKVDIPTALDLFAVPKRSTDYPWPQKYYKAPDITSIMQRVPSHEPWDQHESVSPGDFTLAKTDSTIGTTIKGNNGTPKPVFSEVPAYVAASTGSSPSFNGSNSSGGTSNSFLPNVNPKDYAALSATGTAGQQAIKKAATQLGLTGKQALAALLGIAGGETGWQPIEESFNYKTAARLLEIFPSVFKGDAALAQQYVGNPNNSLPEFLYGYNTSKGRGLGNTQPGDGAAFIGRGFIQITGRSNYTRYSHLLYDNKLIPTPTALIDNPTMLNSLNLAAQVSVLYFLDRVKVDQTSDNYFQAALNSVGYNAPDILAKKTGLYQYFLSTLVTSSSGSVITDSSGLPINSGQIN